MLFRKPSTEQSNNLSTPTSLKYTTAGNRPSNPMIKGKIRAESEESGITNSAKFSSLTKNSNFKFEKQEEEKEKLILISSTSTAPLGKC